MNTKVLMAASALVMLLTGLMLQFFPHEVLGYLGTPATGIMPLVLQLAGAMYLGFASMNWMAKAVLIGGIYARPLALGNLAHFLIGALALIKFAWANNASPAVWVLGGSYAVFAVLFGIVFMTHPVKGTGKPAV